MSYLTILLMRCSVACDWSHMTRIPLVCLQLNFQKKDAWKVFGELLSGKNIFDAV